MIATSQTELLRLLASFCIFFLAGPLIAAAGENGSWINRIAAAFVRASLFFRIALMTAALAGAIFPGIIIGSWLIWLLVLMTWSHGGRPSELGPRVRSAFLRFLEALENWRQARPLSRPRVSRMAALFCLLAFVTLLHRAWEPLHNLRFAEIDTYSRTLELHKFMHGDLRTADGATFLLAPLSIASGLYPDSVMRFSGPLFSTALVLAVAFCAFRLLGSSQAGFIAGALMAAWPALAGARHPGEISIQDIAAVFWVIAAAFLIHSPRLALLACVTAGLVSWRLSPLLLAAAACVLLAYGSMKILAVMPLAYRRVPSFAAAGLTVCLLLADCKASAQDGPFEYESAARASRVIAEQFPRNDWLIVSPVHELAFTYGRGWHFELIDFVYSYSAKEVTPAVFSFPYKVPDIFVFVEKQPLRADFSTADLTQTMDRAVLGYNTGLGRGAIEFQAAALLSAYAAHHSDMSIFHEDERLVVFHIKSKPQQPVEISTASKRGS